MAVQSTTFVMYDEELRKINQVSEKLLRESNSKVIFLVDKNGQLITSVGETEHLDTTSLASLTAGNIAATGGLAKLIGEKEFSILFHEGEKDNNCQSGGRQYYAPYSRLRWFPFADG